MSKPSVGDVIDVDVLVAYVETRRATVLKIDDAEEWYTLRVEGFGVQEMTSEQIGIVE
jgi:hypothetical protein